MAEINKRVLRDVYPRGGERVRLTTTLPAEIDARLRETVTVGRGGEAGPLLALSLHVVLSVQEASFDGSSPSAKHLRELGVILGQLCGRGDDVAAALRVMAQAAERG